MNNPLRVWTRREILRTGAGLTVAAVAGLPVSLAAAPSNKPATTKDHESLRPTGSGPLIRLRTADQEITPEVTALRSLMIHDDGRVAHTGLRLRDGDKEWEIESGYFGQQRPGTSARKAGYDSLHLNPKALFNIGGAVGRQIHPEVGTGDFDTPPFRAWKEQSLEVMGYHPEDRQWSIRADRYPDIYAEFLAGQSIRGIGHRVGRANASQDVQDAQHEPVNPKTTFQSSETIRCFFEVIDSAEAQVEVAWLSPDRSTAERDELTVPEGMNQYRTWLRKRNNPTPGVWGFGVRVAGQAEVMIGFAWGRPSA